MVIGHRERVALRKLNAPEGFEFYKWQCVGTDAVELTGCVPTRTISKGPRKGKPDYKSGKALVAVVTEAEEQAEEARWCAETGKCGRCLGEGKVFAGWHYINGTTYRQCPDCQPAAVLEASR